MSGGWFRAGTAVVLAALFTLPFGCTGDDVTGASTEATESAPAQAVLPPAVSRTRAAILAAAEAGDYDLLRPLVDADVFLSDFGFGDEPDPVGRWQAIGRRPLETMKVLLRMDPVVRETNEGTLYQWPRLGPDSRAGDVSARERELFRTIMTEAELDALVLPEVGYTAPRLGILADGTWWFFILESGP